jgi:NAD(P)H dehydrogenase (quinone)
MGAKGNAMQHAVIFAHPGTSSFTASVADTYAAAAQRLGHSVLRRDLYQIGFDPCLKAGELPRDDSFLPAPDVVRERALLKSCDVFAFVYPLWLNSPPAIIKGYMERVFGFGFAYGAGGHSSNPLLQGRRLISFSSSGAPSSWVSETGAYDAVRRLHDTYFAELCGMTALEHVHSGGIRSGASEFYIQARLEEVSAAVTRYFGRAA